MARMLVLLALFACAGSAQKGGGGLPPDIVPPDLLHPDALRDRAHFQKQYENDRTRVLRLRLKADEISMQHEAPDGLFVCLGECHVRLVDATGHDQDVHLQDGETRWAWAGIRRIRNLSTHPVDMLFVEFRAAS